MLRDRSLPLSRAHSNSALLPQSLWRTLPPLPGNEVAVLNVLPCRPWLAGRASGPANSTPPAAQLEHPARVPTCPRSSPRFPLQAGFETVGSVGIHALIAPSASPMYTCIIHLYICSSTILLVKSKKHISLSLLTSISTYDSIQININIVHYPILSSMALNYLPYC